MQKFKEWLSLKCFIAAIRLDLSTVAACIRVVQDIANDVGEDGVHGDVPAMPVEYEYL